MKVAKRFYTALAVYTVLFVLVPSTSYCEEAKETKKSNLFQADFQNAPTYIRSSEMTLFAETRKVEYRGKVEVLHEDMRMTCDRIEAFYTPENEIDKIYAFDNVFITRETGTQARSEEALYEKKTETITLTVNPEVLENGSVVTADKIRIFLLEDRSEAEGEVRVKLVQAKPEAEVKVVPGAAAATVSATEGVAAVPSPTKKPILGGNLFR